MRYHRLITLFVGTCAVFTLCGCGSGEKTGIVTGTVTIKGSAPTVEGMTVSLLAPTGQVVMVQLGAGGAYRCEVPAGEWSVSVSHPNVPSQASKLLKEKEKNGGLKPALKSGTLKTDTASLAAIIQFDSKYLDPRKSGLKVTVEAGKETVFPIDLR